MYSSTQASATRFRLRFPFAFPRLSLFSLPSPVVSIRKMSHTPDYCDLLVLVRDPFRVIRCFLKRCDRREREKQFVVGKQRMGSWQ